MPQALGDSAAIAAETGLGRICHMVSEPEFQHDERPKAGPMLAAAFDVVGDQGTNRIGAEESPVQG